MTDQNPTQPARILKIGATRIVADASLSQLNPEQLRETLKITYPEIAHATMRETTLEDGTVCIEWVAIPGRKG
jgi:hypothetical protein